MNKIQPVGRLILVEPINREDTQTESGLTVIDKTQLGKVIELSDEFADVYKKGDIVAYSEGAGHGVFYKGKAHLYLNGNGWGNGGDVWSIVTLDKKTKG